MPTVILGREMSKRFEGADAPVVLPASADTIRRVIRELDERFPGIKELLSGPMAVAIDGQLYENSLLQKIPADAEVHFLPPLDGG